MIEYIVTSWDCDSANGSVPEILDSFTSAEDATSYVAKALDWDPDILHRKFDAGVRMFANSGIVYCIAKLHIE